MGRASGKGRAVAAGLVVLALFASLPGLGCASQTATGPTQGNDDEKTATEAAVGITPYEDRGYDQAAAPTERELQIAEGMLSGSQEEELGLDEARSGSWPSDGRLFDVVTHAEMVLDEMEARYGVSFEAAEGLHYPEMLERRYGFMVVPQEGELAGQEFSASYWLSSDDEPAYICDEYFSSLREPELEVGFRAQAEMAAEQAADEAGLGDADIVLDIWDVDFADGQGQWEILPSIGTEELLGLSGYSVSAYVDAREGVPEGYEDFCGRFKALLAEGGRCGSYEVWAVTELAEGQDFSASAAQNAVNSCAEGSEMYDSWHWGTL